MVLLTYFSSSFNNSATDFPNAKPNNGMVVMLRSRLHEKHSETFWI